MIRVQEDGAVRVVELARAEKRNALTPEMLKALDAAFVDVPDGCRAVVLEGDGPVFCAGFDLSACRDDGDEQPTLRALLVGLDRAVRAMRACPAPVVACAHGGAIAGGCALLCGADVVVTDAGAKLGYPVVRLGISPAVSAPGLLSMTSMGVGRAMLLRPGLVSAQHALRHGLVCEVAASAEQARLLAHRIARDIASKPGRGVLETKAWVNELTTIEGEMGIETSLALLGTEESRTMLERAWTKR